MSRIPISDLPEKTAITGDPYIAIDDGTIANKIKVSKFNETSTTSAQAHANAAAASAAEAAESAVRSEAAASSSELALTSVTNMVNRANGYASSAQTSADQAAASAATAINKASEAAMYADDAKAAAEDVDQAALLSESWARGGTGIRPGEDTDNAMYWSRQSRAHTTGGVLTFNHRTDNVFPETGDYSADMIPRKNGPEMVEDSLQSLDDSLQTLDSSLQTLDSSLQTLAEEVHGNTEAVSMKADLENEINIIQNQSVNVRFTSSWEPYGEPVNQDIYFEYYDNYYGGPGETNFTRELHSVEISADFVSGEVMANGKIRSSEVDIINTYIKSTTVMRGTLHIEYDPRIKTYSLVTTGEIYIGTVAGSITPSNINGRCVITEERKVLATDQRPYLKNIQYDVSRNWPAQNTVPVVQNTGSIWLNEETIPIASLVADETRTEKITSRGVRSSETGEFYSDGARLNISPVSAISMQGGLRVGHNESNGRFGYGHIYTMEGTCNGVLVNNVNNNPIELAQGAVYLLTYISHLISSGAFRGMGGYVISTGLNPDAPRSQTGFDTTAKACARWSSHWGSGTTGIALDRSTIEKSGKYYPGIGIGSCTTNCFVKWSMLRLL